MYRTLPGMNCILALNSFSSHVLFVFFFLILKWFWIIFTFFSIYLFLFPSSNTLWALTPLLWSGSLSHKLGHKFSICAGQFYEIALEKINRTLLCLTWISVVSNYRVCYNISMQSFITYHSLSQKRKKERNLCL